MEDHHVDRPDVEARQRVQLTGTNRSFDLIALVAKARARSAAKWRIGSSDIEDRLRPFATRHSRILKRKLGRFSVLCRPGDDLLSHVLRQSTIGAKAFDGRVRDGIGSDRLARATRPAKNGDRTTENRRRRTENRGGISVFCRLSSDICRPHSDRSKTGFWTKEDGRRRRIGNPSSVVGPPPSESRLGDESNQVGRAISTGQLRALPRFHIRPIDVVVFHGSSGRTCFEAGFPLRCLQRLSIPYIATLHCGWRHNRSTRDTFTPVLSY